MKRREFIKASAAIATAAATGTGNMLDAAESLHIAAEAQEDGRLIVSAPLLQNFAAESMGVAFAVSALANGYVLVGEMPDLSDARKVLCGGYRVTDIDDRVIRVRLTGLFTSGPYRQAQVAWLKDALQREEIRTAPFLVAICHIPLFDDNPDHNPGDVAPDDTDPRYSTDYAMWQRTCARLWGSLLEAAGCQLVITAHQHRFRYDAPGLDCDGNRRSWAQIVGGGPEMGSDDDDSRKDPGRFPTVIEGDVRRGRLQITVHNLLSGQVQDRYSFKPRNVV